MKLLSLCILACVMALGTCNHQMHVHNNCAKEVWVGVLPPSNYGGGFKLYPGQQQTINVNNHWSGRVWGRTGCGGSRCETGDCGGGRLQCSGAGGAPPATLAEITFDGAGNQDYYDVSLVDGYNLQLSMYPTPGRHDTANHGHYYCGRAGCTTDLNQRCPRELQMRGSDGSIVACKSACLAFGDPRYCCTGAHNTPATCPYFPYARDFKNACQEAYSYAYDDEKSTFTCRGNGGSSSYEIVFC